MLRWGLQAVITHPIASLRMMPDWRVWHYMSALCLIETSALVTNTWQGFSQCSLCNKKVGNSCQEFVGLKYLMSTSNTKSAINPRGIKPREADPREKLFVGSSTQLCTSKYKWICPGVSSTQFKCAPHKMYLNEENPWFVKATVTASAGSNWVCVGSRNLLPGPPKCWR